MRHDTVNAQMDVIVAQSLRPVRIDSSCILQGGAFVLD